MGRDSVEVRSRSPVLRMAEFVVAAFIFLSPILVSQPGGGPTPSEEKCALAEFTPPLPIAFSQGQKYPFAARFGAIFDSIASVAATSTFDGSDPFDPGDTWYIDNFGGQRHTGGPSTTSMTLNNPWPDIGDFLDGTFEGSYLAEEGHFKLNSLRFCVTLGPRGDPGWCSQVVSTASPWGATTSIALDPSERPHVAFHDPGPGYAGTAQVRYARWIGSRWDVVTVERLDPYGFASLALDGSGSPHLAYYSFAYHGGMDGDLRYARLENGTWIIETVDAQGDTGYWPSLAVDAAGGVHMSYYDATNHALKYAHHAGASWIVETVESAGDSGFHSSLVVDGQNEPHIAYVVVGPDGVHFEIRYARHVAGTWISEMVGGAGTVNPGNWVGGYPSLALDSAGNPHVSFFDVDVLSLRYAHKVGAAWNVETVDAPANPYQPVGLYTALALDSAGDPHMTYLDWWNKDLKYARWTGASWRIERAVATGNVGWWTDLILDSHDRPHISFQDAYTGDIRYATREPCPAANGPPTADAGGPYSGIEGTPVAFDASGSSDPDGDALTYRWDWDGDGSWDETTSSPFATHTFGDDLRGHTVILEVSDGAHTVADQATVTVANAAPALLGVPTATARFDLTLRVAGERWHDVTLTVYEHGTEAARASVVRSPGSPDEQAVTMEGLAVDLLSDAWSAVVVYTPMDDPENGQPNGANPSWLVFTGEDGSQNWLHHIFNVPHPETWTWVVEDLRAGLVGLPIRFAASTTDVGSDDLAFAWSWGDGTEATATTYFANGVGPDPFPSPDVNPIAVTDAVTHAFAAPGTYTVIVRVTDDDGGVASVAIAVVLQG